MNHSSKTHVSASNIWLDTGALPQIDSRHRLKIEQHAITALGSAYKKKVPGKAYREGISLIGLFEMFSNSETFVGALEKNKHKDRKLNAGRDETGKAIVVGMKERDTKKVKAKVIEDTKRHALHGFIEENVETGSVVNTDDFKSYRNLAYYNHEFVLHTIGEYVNEQAHINGIENFWAIFKRAHKGTYHEMSKKHLNRYINEFVVRHNVRELDTINQMEIIVTGTIGRRFKYMELVSGIDGRLN